MSSSADLRPGDLMFGPVSGAAGTLIAAGELVVAPWKHQLTWRRWYRIRHTGTVTSAATPESGPLLVQAEPGGVEQIKMGPEHWTADHVYIRPRYQPGQADRVAAIAVRQATKRIPYAFECYPGILAHRTHLPIPGLDDWLARVDADGDPVRVICSWEVDSQLSLAGFKVFSDGRVPHDVVPSELYLRLLELTPELVIRPGRIDMTSRDLAEMRTVGGVPGYLL